MCVARTPPAAQPAAEAEVALFIAVFAALQILNRAEVTTRRE
jgi:hypothetical protein